MQPGDEKEVFQTPQETEYFSQATSTDAPTEEPVDSLNNATEDELTVTEPTAESVTWEAPEYLQKEKGPLWFIGLGFVTIGFIVLDVFVLKSFLFSFSLLIVVMAVALVVHNYRPANLIHYVLSEKGLYINDILHAFAEFKGFGVIHDGQEFSVELIPVRRFRPSLAVYFPEEQGEAIVDALGVRLPMQTIKPDFFDKIIHSLGL